MNRWPIDARPDICLGRVFHKRTKPFEHTFSYGVFFVRIPVTEWAASKNRWLSLDGFNVLSLHRKDYGPRDGSAFDVWAQNLLRAHGVERADGSIVLQTFPRLLGFVFNPISVWYCHDRAGHLIAAIAEVNNTFGERHNYVVAHADQRPILPGDWILAQKVFHVSPFCEIKGHYRFRFEQHAGRAFAQIDYHDEAAESGKLLVTTIHGAPLPLTASSALSAVLKHPLMTFGVVARIHWQAFKLWLKRLPFFSKPEPPSLETTR
ncbi:MAG: DUF1365 domain-containing protein [Betaproteobacteria bacterium]|nr:DUF1365 domain-containing protein [Betaproteobacteria bacterium]